MEKKHQVHNLIILDESGSMESIKTTIIQGFNEIVQTVKGIEKEFMDQEHFISLITFNGLGQKLLHFVDPVQNLNQIDDERYDPTASTPLFDAMGFGLNKLKKHLANETDYNVLVTILTDGEENASKEYSGNDIKKLIEELKLNRWTFTYIGTEHDVEKIALSLSITNTMTFSKNESDMLKMFESEKMARSNYSHNIRFNKETSDDFYKSGESLD
jgi:Mg-chelatase subunit ChlD